MYPSFFFDNELEDLREFDVDSQRSIRNLAETQIPPAREWLLDSEQIANLSKKIKQTAKHQMEIAYRQERIVIRVKPLLAWANVMRNA